LDLSWKWKGPKGLSFFLLRTPNPEKGRCRGCKQVIQHRRKKTLPAGQKEFLEGGGFQRKMWLGGRRTFSCNARKLRWGEGDWEERPRRAFQKFKCLNCLKELEKKLLQLPSVE